MTDISATEKKPNYQETVYRGCEAFLRKLSPLGVSDSSFSYWLTSAALNLCVNVDIVQSQSRPKYVDDLVEKVKNGLEQMKEKKLLNALPEEERARLKYCQELFARTLNGKHQYALRGRSGDCCKPKDLSSQQIVFKSSGDPAERGIAGNRILYSKATLINVVNHLK